MAHPEDSCISADPDRRIRASPDVPTGFEEDSDRHRPESKGPTMNTTIRDLRETAAPPSTPSRRSLVAMASVVLVGYLAMFATGTDLQYDAGMTKIRAAYDGSQGASQLSAYAGMAFVALLLFFGAALRTALRASGRTWLADVPFIGFAALGATIASWAVTDIAMWKAVDFGDEGTIRTLVTISDAGFLPLMAAMIAIYVGTGLVGMTTGAVPKWLAIASIIIGVLAPLGPLGFVGALLLPLWVLAVAICVRLDDAS